MLGIGTYWTNVTRQHKEWRSGSHVLHFVNRWNDWKTNTNYRRKQSSRFDLISANAMGFMVAAQEKRFIWFSSPPFAMNTVHWAISTHWASQEKLSTLRLNIWVVDVELEAGVAGGVRRTLHVIHKKKIPLNTNFRINPSCLTKTLFTFYKFILDLFSAKMTWLIQIFFMISRASIPANLTFPHFREASSIYLMGNS